MIIDSSFLFDLMAGEEGAFSKGIELAETGEMQWLPAPVIAEAYYGVATVRSQTSEREVRNRLLGYPPLSVDVTVARRAGLLLADADDRAGGDAAVGANDAYIAAMADLHDDAVLTDNVEDFEKLGVPVETY